MKSRSLYLLLVFFICIPAKIWANPSDAIVTIWTDLGHGRRALGTGFFTSSDGQVTTAYHVIQNARGIQVLHSGNGYSNIIIESISPEHDVARLRILGLSQSTPYLDMVYEFPRKIQDEELFVFGHAGGISNQRLVARMTRPRPTLSREIRGSRLQRLFRLEDVRLLPLQTTIYNGLSGGPVLSKHGVVGILSGSIEEGGTIAWAIPSEYVQHSKMRILNKPPRDIRNWPELTLMARNWKNLRKRSLINEGLARAIEQYFFAVDDLAAIHEKIPLLLLDAQVSTQMLRKYIEQRAELTLDEILDPDSYLAQKFEETILALEEAFKERPAAHLKVAYRIQNLRPPVLNFVKNDIAKTQKNYRINKELTQSLRSISSEGFDMETLEIADQKAKEMAGLFGEPVESMADLLYVIQALEDLLTECTKPGFIMDLEDLIRRFRKVGNTVQGLLVADFEGFGENWLFTSDWGYEILMPSEWEFVAPGDDSIVSEQAEVARSKGMVLDAVCRNSFGRKLGLPSMVALQLLIIRDLAISELSDNLISEWNQGVRLSFPDARAYSKRIGDKKMLVGYYEIQRPDQLYINYYAVIPYKENALCLIFEIPFERAESLMPQCEQVLELISMK